MESKLSRGMPFHPPWIVCALHPPTHPHRPISPFAADALESPTPRGQGQECKGKEPYRRRNDFIPNPSAHSSSWSAPSLPALLGRGEDVAAGCGRIVSKAERLQKRCKRHTEVIVVRCRFVGKLQGTGTDLRKDEVAVRTV